MSEAADGNDYFLNHDVVETFPFCFYHRPIRKAVLDFISEQEKTKASLRILNVGCGLSHVLKSISSSHQYQGVDVDPRVIECCRREYADRGARFEVSLPYSLPVPNEAFDVVFATEVVEHVLEPERWLEVLVSKLDHGGGVQLSTPNYGGWLLPFLERTFLEWVARRKGFTRRGLHPTPFTAEKLYNLLAQAGLTNVGVRKTPFNLALIGTGYRI